MQVTIDIPEAFYRELQARASVEQKTIQEALLEQAFGIASASGFVTNPGQHRVHLPLLPAAKPGSVDLNQNLNDALFDDFDPS